MYLPAAGPLETSRAGQRMNKGNFRSAIVGIVGLAGANVFPGGVIPLRRTADSQDYRRAR